MQIVQTARTRAPTSPARFRCRPRFRSSTVIRGPHIDKDSREQFEIRTHKRLIDVLDPNARTLESLAKLALPAGVDIEMKL